MEPKRDHKNVEGGLEGEARRDYMHALLRDLRALERMVKEGMFERGVSRIGSEQEMFLVDGGYHATPGVLKVLEKLDGHFTTELGAFNLEANADAQPFSGKGLSTMETQLTQLLQQVREAGEPLGITPVLCGILPTLGKTDLGLDNMVPKQRYQQLNHAMNQARGEAFDFSIRGIDELVVKHDSVMVEACCASFQVHLQLAEPEKFAHHYNLAQLLTGPILAVSTNSPLLFNRRLWAETRIALFEQSCDIRTPGLHLRDSLGRVSFGRGWLKGSVVDLYKENVSRFRPLVGAQLADEDDGIKALDEGRVPTMKALRTHNGTIYRWNRVAYGISENGKPHLRIELRVLPSGPTIADEVANGALWLGLMTELGPTIGDIPSRMSFDDARANLYAAAREGIRARLMWLDGEEMLAPQLLLEKLIPLATKGLQRMNIDDADIARYMGILERRAKNLRTGANWSLQSLSSMGTRGTPGQRLTAMTAGMVTRQKDNKPVCDWDLARIDERESAHTDYQKVSQFMLTDIFTVRPDDPIELVSELMAWERARYVPVEDDRGRLVGLVSFRGVMRHMSDIARGVTKGEMTAPVSSIMRTELVTVTPDTGTREAVALMRQHRIGALPVVQGEHIVAMLTEEEFVGLAAKAVEELTQPPRSSSTLPNPALREPTGD
jgi:CBS domain-containing protein/gamma-glutamylcysteine synthetase